MEKKSNEKIFVFGLIVLVLSFLLVSGDAFMDSKLVNGNNLVHSNDWRWFPSVLTFSIGVLLGWLIFKKEA